MATVEREKLYEQIWTIPAARLSTLYGISDVGLAKVCKRHKIPRPPRGYWAKVAAGQKPRRAPLPKISENQRSVVRMQGWDLPGEDFDMDAAAPMQTQVAAMYAAPHPLVDTARAQLEVAKPDQNGLLRTDAGSSPKIHVSPASVPRCLGLVESLIRKWEARGGKLVVGAAGGTKTALAIGPDELFFEMYEEIDEKRPVSDLARLTGRLVVVAQGAGISRRWADRKTQRLEKVMGTLVATAAQALEIKKAERLDAECVERQKQVVRELRDAAVAKNDLDFSQRQQLMAYVDRWHEARRIRAYLDALQAAVQSQKVRPVDDASFRDWLEWANWYADSIDPILQAQRPEEEPLGPTNTPVAELDITRHSRSLVSKLNINDSDQLATVTWEKVQEACGYDRELWQEINRVLEGLGYDVAKRKDTYGWY